MSKLSRKETAGIAALIIVVGTGLIWALVRSVQAATSPGVTLHEAFAQPPGGPLPGRLPVVVAATSAVPPAVPDSGTAHLPAAPASVSPSASDTPPAVEPQIAVHVAGAVRKPGVYHLSAGARNDDAIKMAGGPNASANMDAINLAAKVEDGSQLYLPNRKEHPDGGADAPTTPATTLPAAPSAAKTSKAADSKPGSKAGAHTVAKSASGAKSGKSGKLSSPAQGTVNINTASVEELQRIPGIGPAMAERILEFRAQSGKFTAPEDLLQISGIGEKKFAKMQPFVRVR